MSPDNEKKTIKNNPKFSIITVVLNNPNGLKKTIESVANQSYKSYEYIIVDGGSRNETIDIIKHNREIVTNWICESDKGIYDAMNKGAAIARGEWLLFLNSGDLFYDSSVLTTVSTLLEGDLVYGNHAVYNVNWESPVMFDVSKRKDTRNIPYCHQSSFIRTFRFREFPFNINYKLAADYDQYLRCKASGLVIKHIPVFVSNYLDGGVSEQSRIKLISEYYKIGSKYRPIRSLFVYALRLLKFHVIGI